MVFIHSSSFFLSRSMKKNLFRETKKKMENSSTYMIHRLINFSLYLFFSISSHNVYLCISFWLYFASWHQWATWKFLLFSRTRVTQNSTWVSVHAWQSLSLRSSFSHSSKNFKDICRSDLTLIPRSSQKEVSCCFSKLTNWRNRNFFSRAFGHFVL